MKLSQNILNKGVKLSILSIYYLNYLETFPVWLVRKMEKWENIIAFCIKIQNACLCKESISCSHLKFRYLKVIYICIAISLIIVGTTFFLFHFIQFLALISIITSVSSRSWSVSAIFGTIYWLYYLYMQ